MLCAPVFILHLTAQLFQGMSFSKTSKLQEPASSGFDLFWLERHLNPFTPKLIMQILPTIQEEND